MPLPPRGVILDAVLEHSDEHIAKLAYSMYREYEARGLSEHRVILARITAGQAALNFG